MFRCFEKFHLFQNSVHVYRHIDNNILVILFFRLPPLAVHKNVYCTLITEMRRKLKERLVEVVFLRLSYSLVELAQ